MSPLDLIAWTGAIALAAVFLAIATVVVLAALAEIRKAALRRHGVNYPVQTPRR